MEGNQSTTQHEDVIQQNELYRIKKGQNILRALNHPLRNQLLNKIDELGNRATVTELYIKLRMEQSVCSQHLAILRTAGAVKTTRDGKWIYYAVDHERIKHIKATVETLIQQPTS